MSGGAGNDTYYVDNSGDVVIESLNQGTDRVFSTINYTLGSNLENLILSGTGNINGTGNTLNNRITGNTGNNIFRGGNGTDTLIGGAGNDTLIGGAGNDSLVGGNGNDSLTGGQGKDNLRGNPGRDTFAYNALTDSLLVGFDVVKDYSGIGASPDRINAPGAIPAVNLTASKGTAANLSLGAIQAVLTPGAFGANTAAAFKVTGQSGTFIALNNGVAGFQAATDAILQLEGYNLSGANPVLVI
jgi:Ca2+-binding RTX toxin-like protein